MEVVASAVTGDLVSRFISFLMNKCWDHASLDEKMERMQQLLVRIRLVVDEADGRYITNNGMLIQLKTLAETMYRGYHVLDTLNYIRIKDGAKKRVSEASFLSFTRPLKRYRTTVSATNKVQSALENLETVIGNMAEFVMLLGGCDRMSRRPFDAYVYIDNFMFGRHTEKHQITNILLQDNPLGTPTVVPIIGRHGVGKKTLIAHICENERVRTSFSLILHLKRDSLLRVDNHDLKFNKTLVIVVLDSNVSDQDWAELYSSIACIGTRSKVVIVSKVEAVARFGTVRSIHISSFSDQEFSYLFKTLSFGSENPEDHPQLLPMVKDFVTEMKGSLVGAHIVADVLRKNINLKFWLYMLEMCRKIVQRNIALYGEHPMKLFGRNHPVDMPNAFFDMPNAFFSTITPLHLLSNTPKIELPLVRFGDLLANPTVRPTGEFNLVTWESRIPPYARFVHYVPTCANDHSEAS